MSKHTLQSRGLTFVWDDDKDLNTVEDKLLKLYGRVGDMYSWSMYEGEDPYKRWNDHVYKVQELILDWIIDEREIKLTQQSQKEES